MQLKRVFDPADTRRMGDAIWRLLEQKHAVRRDDPVTWTVRRPAGFQSLTRTAVFQSVAAPVLLAALNDLIGAGRWSWPQQWGAPLVTFPERGAPRRDS